MPATGKAFCEHCGSYYDRHADRKRSVYLDAETVDELHAEARRLGRTVSWVMFHAWKLARKRIRSERPQFQEPTEAA